MLQQGLRPQKLLVLQKEHVDLEKRELSVIDSKTAAATRTINLTSASCVILGWRMAGNSARGLSKNARKTEVDTSSQPLQTVGTTLGVRSAVYRDSFPSH